MRTKPAINLLVFLLVFLGMGAIGGGGIFIIAPDGSLMGMPISVLDDSPFHSFLLPGIILFMVLGIAPLLLTYALVKKPASSFAERLNIFSDMHWAWSFTIYTAFALIIWIQVQMALLAAVHWLHTFYMLYAIAILLTALLPPVRRLFKKAAGQNTFHIQEY